MTRRHVNDRVNGDTETSIKQPLTSICLCHGSVFVQFSSAKNHAYLPNCCVFTRMYSFCNMLETKVGSFGRIGPRRQLAGVGIASADTMRSNIAILSIYIDNQIIYNSVYYIFLDIVQDENCGRFNQRGVARQSSCNERRYKAIWKKVTAANRNSFGDVEG